MVAADGLSLADFLGQLIEMEHRVWDRTLDRRCKALLKVSEKRGDDGIMPMMAAIKAGRRSFAGVSLAAWS